MNEHIRDDIESNLMSGKEPFWKQIKKMTFMQDKEGKISDTPQETKPPAEDKSL